MSSLQIIPLFSGSSGNATLIKADDYCFLIDAGRNCKQVTIALEAVGVSPDQIKALFITHSHHDHLDALDVFVRKHPVSVFATEYTHRAIARKCTKPHPMSPDIEIVPGEAVDLSEDLSVYCCETPHDARGSVCYKIRYKDKSCMVMTDLGEVTDDIKRMAFQVDGILIEANYDQKMLVYGPYPEDLKARVAGRSGHLSNDDSAEMIRQLIENGTRKFILGHLSINNNTREKARATVTSYLKGYGYEEGRDYYLDIANRYEPTKALEI